ncbi:MAG: D-alanine--poly(phosphoribitol) ligase subunit DltC [Eubacteriaceae bacterium]|nr:D-alanine--poly(phosphoribitol) ligase subunit DltC [Eubacteriaceae bacterium]
MNKSVKERVFDILVEICDEEIVREDIDINLLDEELMDSLDYTDLIIRLEEEFDIVISPSEYTREESDTPAKIIGIVEAGLQK